MQLTKCSDIVHFMINIKKIKPEFTDQRGEIRKILEIDPTIKTALLITSRKGAVRANHFHKHDTHYTFLLSGKFDYLEKGLGMVDQLETAIILPGDLVITPPNKMHAMKFKEDSVMLVFSTEARDQASYEEDTVRVKLV